MLSLPLLSWIVERKQTEKLAGQDKDKELTHQLPSCAKQTQLGENSFNLLSIRSE